MTPLSCVVEHEHAKIALLLVDDNDTAWKDVAVEDYKQVLKLRASRVQETNRDTRRRDMAVIIIGSISMIICRSVVARIQQRFK